MLRAFALLVVAAEASSLRAGENWLRQHANPSVDELAELKDTNPEAYGLVKALLMKRSLGLLDPKHPTSSFAAATPAPLSEEAAGPQAFAKFATVSDHSAPSSTDAYPEAPPVQSHHDWLNWKPQDSAASEDAEVSNVLGAVAQVATPTKSLLSRNRESSPAVEAPTAPPAASTVQDNSYLKDVNLGSSKPAAVSKPVAHENSYLAAAGLGGDAVDEHSSDGKPQENLLASFSWGDDSAPQASSVRPVASSLAAQRTVVAVQDTVADKTNAPTAPKARPVDPLAAWLGGKAASKPRIAVAAQAAKAAPKNSYLMDLE